MINFYKQKVDKGILEREGLVNYLTTALENQFGPLKKRQLNKSVPFSLSNFEFHLKKCKKVKVESNYVEIYIW